MSVLLILIFASLSLAAVFLFGFIWAVKSGQFEDTGTPALRILPEDPPAIAITEFRSNGSCERSISNPLPQKEGPINPFLNQS
jgi:cbb3-type cytochrome oxidase maturation protein